MFLKVFKHEFKSVLKTMLITLAVGLLASLALGGVNKFMYALAERLNEGPTYNYTVRILQSMIAGMSPMALVIIFLAQSIIVFLRFYKSIATDAAYLTFTLPSDNVTQYKSRFLSLLCWIAISAVALTINFIVYEAISAIGTVSPLMQFGEYVGEYYFNYSDFIDWLLLIEIIFGALVLIVFECLQLCFAILLATKLAKKFKIGATILFIFLIEHVESILLSTIFVMLIGNVNFSTADAREGLAIVVGGFILLLAGVSVLWYCLSKKIVENLNVD